MTGQQRLIFFLVHWPSHCPASSALLTSHLLYGVCSNFPPPAQSFLLSIKSFSTPAVRLDGTPSDGVATSRGAADEEKCRSDPWRAYSPQKINDAQLFACQDPPPLLAQHFQWEAAAAADEVARILICRSRDVSTKCETTRFIHFDAHLCDNILCPWTRRGLITNQRLRTVPIIISGSDAEAKSINAFRYHYPTKSSSSADVINPSRHFLLLPFSDAIEVACKCC